MSSEASEDLSGLSLTELLDQLEPIVVPAPVSWWPQAPGWSYLGIFLLFVILFLAWRYLKKRRANRYRRDALSELALLEKSLDDAASADLVAGVAALVRRTAMARYGREQVAACFGDRWLAFLDAKCRQPGFSQGAASVLASAPYDGRASREEAIAAIAAARVWIRSHHA
jgi:hypothetical protein